jgi:predicted SAM-dependent methyltransferase
VTANLKERFLGLLGTRAVDHSWIVSAHYLRRKILRSDERLRNVYLRQTGQPKLQIGGGWNRLDGWLNTDLKLVPGVMLMDATERFPFSDETMEFVFTEHMIEHVSQKEGTFMLRECYRVMRKGGVIRVTTPNLVAITGLCSDPLSEVQRKYLSWFCQTFIKEECPSKAASAINAFFRMWGHQFIYDELTLSEALCAAGFHSVRRHPLGNSDHPALRNLENTQRYPEGLLDFESVALEARK